MPKEINWPHHQEGSTSFYLLYSCSRDIICFNPVKGYIVGRLDTHKHLRKRGHSPVLIAVPRLEVEATSGTPVTFKGLFIAPSRIPFGAPSPEEDAIDHAIDIEITTLKTPYQRADRSGLFVELNSAQGIYLSASPSKKHWKRADYEAIDVRFCRTRAEGRERFWLCPIDETNISCDFHKDLNQLLASSRPSQSGCNSSFHSTALAPFHLTRNDKREQERLRKQGGIFEKLDFKHCRKTDLETQSTYHLGPALDHLGRDNQAFSGKPIGRSSFANYLARRHAKITDGPCIVATARNEAIYLPDWCSHHLSLGFEHIYLYTNDNADNTLEIAQRLAEITGQITVINNQVADSKSRPQFKAYRHALTYSKDILRHSWSAIIDIDEYIVLRPEKNGNSCIQDFILSIAKQSLSEPDVIVLNWVFAGLDRSLPAERTPSSLPDRILTSLGPNPHIKSLFRPHKFLASHCHYPVESGIEVPTVVDSFGCIYTPYFTSIEPGIAPKPRIKKAAVMHFWHKSFTEYMWKTMRNTGDQPLATITHPDINRLEAFCKIYFEDAETPHRAVDWLRSSRKFLTKDSTRDKIYDDPMITQLMQQSWCEMRETCSRASKALLKDSNKISSGLQTLLEQHVQQYQSF